MSNGTTIKEDTGYKFLLKICCIKCKKETTVQSFKAHLKTHEEKQKTEIVYNAIKNYLIIINFVLSHVLQLIIILEKIIPIINQGQNRGLNQKMLNQSILK